MRHFLLLLLAVTGISSSCRKETTSGVPPVQLDITININLPEFADLQVPGGWVYLTGGSLGLIVYRKDIESFIAMDRHCPYQPENLCTVFVNEDQVTATDSLCCDSRFLLQTGQLIEGPAGTDLRVYNTLFNGTTLRIYN